MRPLYPRCDSLPQMSKSQGISISQAHQRSSLVSPPQCSMSPWSDGEGAECKKMSFSLPKSVDDLHLSHNRRHTAEDLQEWLPMKPKPQTQPIQIQVTPATGQSTPFFLHFFAIFPKIAKNRGCDFPEGQVFILLILK